MTRTLMHPAVSVKDHLKAEQIASLEQLIRDERIGARMSLREFLIIAAIVTASSIAIFVALAMKTGGFNG